MDDLDQAPETLELRIQRWPFVQIPSVLLISSLSDGAKLTYAFLQLWAGLDGKAFPSRPRLAEARGIATPTLYRQLAELQQAGWLDRFHQVVSPTQTRHVILVRTRLEHRGVSHQREGGCLTGERGGVSLVREGVSHQGDTEREPRKENQGNTSPPPGGGDQVDQGGNGTKKKTRRKGTWTPSASEKAAFDRWWKLVPRKVGKAKALVTFVKCARGYGGETMTIQLPDEETLHRGTRRWAREAAERGEPQFVKHPQTWLNSEGWEDEDGLARVETGPTPQEVADRQRRQQEADRARFAKQARRAGVDPKTLGA